MTEDRLDQILNEMRNEDAGAAEVEAAKGRVWEKLSAAHAVCGAFQADFAAYRAGGLTESRRMLVADHLGRCPDCRAIFSEGHARPKVIPMPEPKRWAPPRWTAWAVAAGLAAVAVYTGRGQIDRALAPSGPAATVAAISGGLDRLAGAALRDGDALAAGESVRTAAGGHAVLTMTDGSRIEMNERTELRLAQAWSGNSIQLDRGDIIVTAAKQRRGALRVVTGDSVVSVRGTVFSVSSGVAGSVVGVVEGSVGVEQASGRRLLKPGEVAASNAALQRTTVRETVRWSPDAEKYLALLGELAGLKNEIAAALPHDLRTAAPHLAALPAGLSVYIAVPNLGAAAKETLAAIERRTQQSAALREWWDSSPAQGFRTMLDKLQAVSPLLGPEIVFAAVRGQRGAMILAEVKPGQETALNAALAGILPGEKLRWQISGGRLRIVAQGAAWTPGGAPTPFTTEIAARYRRGVSWLIALDLSAHGGPSNGLATVIFEEKTVNGQPEDELALGFKGPRAGFAGWLAPAASAGSAEYVSSGTTLAFSAATRDPREIFAEAVALAGKVSGGTKTTLDELESVAGVNAGAELAAAFGTDFTISVEQPRIPLPGWFAAVEVRQPSAIDGTLRTIVAALGKDATLSEEVEDGRTWLTLKAQKMPTALTWTYDRGYMLIGNERAILRRAIATRTAGLQQLVRSAAFRDRVPAAAGLHQSAFLWVNAQGPVADLAGLVEMPAVKQLLASREPYLFVINGEREQIRAFSRTRFASMLFDLVFPALLKPPRG